jgi:tetratricopeptide (TPR) repeat protein
MMRKYAALLITFAAVSFQINAQDARFDSIVVEGIKQVYRIEFETANKTFQKLITDYPNHPAGYFFIAMIDWWHILLDTSTDQYDKLFFEKIDNVIERCDKILEEDPNNVDALFFKGGSIGFKGRLNSLRDDWLSAADNGRIALHLVYQAGEVDSTNVDVQLGFGIYNYYAAVIPEEYPIVKPLMIFLPSGDKELGIKQLNSIAESGKYTKYEAQYFLMTLYYNFEKDFHSAEGYSIMLNKEFPNNPVFERWRGRIAIKNSDIVLADTIFKRILWKADKNLPGYNTPRTIREASYYVAYRYRTLGMNDSAQVYFEDCLEYSMKVDEYRESGFLINATLYLGLIKEVKKEYAAAKMYYEKVLDMNEFANSHTLAGDYLERIEKIENSGNR